MIAHDAARVGRGERLAAIDVFRGLTIVGMLVVNNPGDPATTYAPLRHSLWNGCTIADLVFPFFLFVVGITTHMSLSRRLHDGSRVEDIRRHIINRAAIIFGLGVLLNWYPFIQSGAIDLHPSPTLIDRFGARLMHLRFLGVLQRIGLVYLVAALLSWRASATRVVASVVILLIGYWLLLTLVTVPDGGVRGSFFMSDAMRTLPAWVDRVTLDWSRFGVGDHRWDGAGGIDPEGLLSTLPAIATTLLGELAGRWLSTLRPPARLAWGLSGAGIAGMAIGLLWGLVFPINKSIWTSSYVVFTAGVACVVLAGIMWLVSIPGWKRRTRPLIAFGANSIVAYVGSELLANILHSSIKPRMDGHRVPTQLWVTSAISSLGTNPYAASLLFSVLFILLWYSILRQLHRRRIYLRI